MGPWSQHTKPRFRSLGWRSTEVCFHRLKFAGALLTSKSDLLRNTSAKIKHTTTSVSVLTKIAAGYKTAKKQPPSKTLSQNNPFKGWWHHQRGTFFRILEGKADSVCLTITSGAHVLGCYFCFFQRKSEWVGTVRAASRPLWTRQGLRENSIRKTGERFHVVSRWKFRGIVATRSDSTN